MLDHINPKEIPMTAKFTPAPLMVTMPLLEVMTQHAARDLLSSLIGLANTSSRDMDRADLTIRLLHAYMTGEPNLRYLDGDIAELEATIRAHFDFIDRANDPNEI